MEFPDVFHTSRFGFDAVVGNPPWEIFQKESKGFFTEFDPLYRTYDKEVIALDPCVTEEFLKLYVAYKAEMNFVEVVP